MHFVIIGGGGGGWGPIIGGGGIYTPHPPVSAPLGIDIEDDGVTPSSSMSIPDSSIAV